MHAHPHGEQHDHDQAHHHHDAGEVRARPVVLDLGAGIGALIVRTDPGLLGVEVELSPAGADGNRQHKEVLERAVGSGTATVLVYDNLPEGDYTLWLHGTAVARNVRVESGAVAEFRL